PEGGAAPERSGDALSDRVGRAVRPGHDRVDGVWNARDGDAPRRRARGDRARPQRDHRRSLSRDARRTRGGGQARAARVPALCRGALRSRTDGRELPRGLPRRDRKSRCLAMNEVARFREAATSLCRLIETADQIQPVEVLRRASGLLAELPNPNTDASWEGDDLFRVEDWAAIQSTLQAKLDG